MRIIDQHEVARRLTYPVCIPLVRAAMVAFSSGQTRQSLRDILPLSPGRLFGCMPGALGAEAAFGAKLISVFAANPAAGRQSHQGLVVLFDPHTGEPVCCVHAGELTAIRTAAASAVATDALARGDARVLAILGTGEQALTHARAIAVVRPLREILIWGRRPEAAASVAGLLAAELGLPVRAAPTVGDATRHADIICTVTAAEEPILHAADIAAGAHINVVGSGFDGPAEISEDLVCRARFFADSRAGVLAQGAEFRRALRSGAITEAHLLGEIGEVLAGSIAGRYAPDEVTIYKSLGHIVQDLAPAWAMFTDAVP